jgi:hypothetical protein
MRFGTWRGLPLAIAAALGLGVGLAGSARADGQLFQHTIPRTVAAYDYTTGRQYQAPPIPYGHYAKDYIDDADKALGCVSCRLHALVGGGGAGHGLFHHGDGDCGDGSTCGHKHGLGHGGGACGATGVNCGSGSGGGSPCGVGGCGGGSACKHFGSHGGAGYACTQTVPSAQASVYSSAQSSCGQPGCKIRLRHGHGAGLAHNGPCGICGGADPACGKGHGHSGGHGGCAVCGGAGCNHCLGSALGSGLSGLHGKLASLAAGLYRPKTSWFVGPGGPVPLTPGYVPYIVTTRSPRDFFAFAPMNPYDR